MTKQEILDKLKASGLNLAEDTLKDALEVMMEVIEELVKGSENKVDDIILAVLPLIKPLILEQIDKIDGEVG